MSHVHHVVGIIESYDCPQCIEREADFAGMIDALRGIYELLTSPQAPPEPVAIGIIEDIVDEALHGESVHGKAIAQLQEEQP